MKYCWILTCLTLFSCSEPETTHSSKESFGDPNSLAIIISPEWSEDSLGLEVLKVLNKDYEGVSQKAARFRTHPHYGNLSSTVREHHLQIHFVNLTDSTEPGMEQKILLAKELNKCDSFPCLFTVKNKWAHPQTVVGIAGVNIESLYELFVQSEDSLIDILESEVLNSYKTTMARIGLLDHQLQIINAGTPVKISCDTSWKPITQDATLCWFRKSSSEMERSIIAIPLDSSFEDTLTPASFWALRDSLFKQKSALFTEISKVSGEKRIPLKIKRTKLNNIFALEVVGRWKLADQEGVGGTFISYLIPAGPNIKPLYIEGFLYTPGENEPDEIRRLKTILSTLEINSNE